MNKNLLFTFALIFCLSQSIAQEGAFTVILNKGQNTIANDKSSKAIVVGTTANEDQTLSVSDNGYVALVHNQTGSGMEITKAGEYKVSDLMDAIASKENSVLSKYGKFLMSSLMNKSEQHQNLNVTGAVERGSQNIIQVFLPKITNVYGSELLVNWKTIDNINDYVVTVKNKLDQTIFVANVSGNRLVLQLDGKTFHDEQMLVLNVQAKSKSSFVSKDYGIRRVDGVYRESIHEQYSHLLEAADTDKTLGKLLIATFFEENQLTADALSYYEEAVKTSPDPNGFAVLYNSFLTRNGLK